MLETKKLTLGAIAVAVAAILFWASTGGANRPPGSTYSQFLEEVRTGKVDTVSIAPGNSGANPATYRLKGGNTATTVLPSDYRDAIAAMQAGSVDISIQESPWGKWRPLTNAIPFLILVGVWLFMVGRLKGRTGIA